MMRGHYFRYKLEVIRKSTQSFLCPCTSESINNNTFISLVKNLKFRDISPFQNLREKFKGTEMLKQTRKSRKLHDFSEGAIERSKFIQRLFTYF